MNDLIPITDKEQLIKAIKESYNREARRFLTYAEEHGLSLDTLKEYIRELEGEGKAVSTINKHIAACRAVIRRLFESPHITDIQKWKLEKAIDKVPFRKQAKNARAVTKEKYLTREEIEILFAKSPARTGVMVKFLADTGLRISEALNIKLDDCKRVGTGLELRVVGKGKKERKVKISMQMYKMIRMTYHDSSTREYLFESLSGNQLDDRNVAKELRRLGWKHLHRNVAPHMLRHSFATHMIQKTGKRKAVSEYLGHSSTAITEDMYNHETLDDADLGLILTENGQYDDMGS